MKLWAPSQPPPRVGRALLALTLTNQHGRAVRSAVQTAPRTTSSRVDTDLMRWNSDGSSRRKRLSDSTSRRKGEERCWGALGLKTTHSCITWTRTTEHTQTQAYMHCLFMFHSLTVWTCSTVFVALFRHSLLDYMRNHHAHCLFYMHDYMLEVKA